MATATALDIPFTKMNGLGNDFVVIDARSAPVSIAARHVRAIADRDTGVGCDQLIVLEPSQKADVFMRIYNADGSEVAACGNATRCVPKLLAVSLQRNAISVETKADVLLTDIRADGLISVDMGAPRFDWQSIPLARPFEDTRAIDLTYELQDGRTLRAPSVVNVGNPHCIFWVETVESYPLADFGHDLEHHPLFPERANISLAETITPNRIAVRVWERGAGITQACGTAACAVAAAAVRCEKAEAVMHISLPGGDLALEWRAHDGHIIMTGPASLDFEGVLHLDDARDAVTFERRDPPA